MATNQKLSETLFVMASSMGFAVVPTITRTAYDEGANALGVMTPRFAIAAILITAIRLLFGKKEGWPDAKLMIAMFFIGAIGVTAVSLLYFIAIGQIDSSLAIVLWYAYPVLVLLIAWVIFLNSSTASSPDNTRVYRATIAPLDQPAALGSESLCVTKTVRLRTF